MRDMINDVPKYFGLDGQCYKIMLSEKYHSFTSEK